MNVYNETDRQTAETETEAKQNVLYDAHDADIVVWARSRSILAKNKKGVGLRVLAAVCV